MSGLIRGKIECVINTGNRQSHTQVFFKNIYDFFSSHPNYTVIALQYGLTGSNLPGSTTSGTGTGYYDQANSFGYNAFFVVRANATTARPFDVYYLFQWAGSFNQIGTNAALGAAIGPGAPALANGNSSPFGVNNNTSLIYQAAIGIGGTGGSGLSPNNGNPWKGTTNGNGLDLKTQLGPIWSAPAGGGTGVMIFPRSNSGMAGNGAVGSFVSKAQNGAILYASSTDAKQTRLSIVGDDDSWAILNDDADNGTYFVSYAGLYVPRPNIAQNPPYPFCTFSTSDAPPFSFADQSVYGDLAGTSNRQGGICSALSGTVLPLQLDHLVNNFLVDSNFWPDRQIPGTTYNEFPIWVGPFENAPLQQSGFMGQLTFLREMFNVPTNDTKSDFSRIFTGGTTLAASKISAPWDSQTNTVPRSGVNRTGVIFSSSLGSGAS